MNRPRAPERKRPEARPSGGPQQLLEEQDGKTQLYLVRQDGRGRRSVSVRGGHDPTRR
jgi:hypothetical protein